MSSLIRQDTGAQLVLDGVVQSKELHATKITRHPVETQETITDHAQVESLGRQVEWIVSQTPALPGLTTGPERIAEVIDWLTGVERGTPLTLVETDLPVRRDLRLESWPYTKDTTSIRLSLSLRQGIVARSRTIELRPEQQQRRRTGTTPRADVAAGRAPTEDRGQRAPQSFAVATSDLVLGYFGLLPAE